MIRCIFVFNQQGHPRLIRYYDRTSVQKRPKIFKEVVSLVSASTETGESSMLAAPPLWDDVDSRIVARHYATLHFVFVIDGAESELATLDLIQGWVHTLDRVFGNVCELDIVHNFEKVQYTLDEIITGGIVIEPNVDRCLTAIQAEKALLDKEQSIFATSV